MKQNGIFYSYRRASTIFMCRKSVNSIYIFIGLFVSFFSFFSQAATPEQIDAIKATAEEFVLDRVMPPESSNIEARAGNIDSRIFATDCYTGLIASSSNTRSTSNMTVLVECPEDAWRIYVPVRIITTGPQVTALTSLARGHLITAADVTVSYIDVNRSRRQGFTDIDQVVGSKVKRSIRAGSTIERGDVCVVCRNEEVMIKAERNGMTISTKGTALSDGSIGEQIRVKNNKSNRIIDASVSGIGEVSVQF
ncbi:flagellar basal body P-ring formation chaperone FlgA [Vibrio agarivorans]|uniref:Flagella basal body P-ring formation protein FlgA n=1 Tax=Vibrio agarivorans TaxID=153622 RepID=A0ABT7XXQ1_9VIBR|nr:flagellar basal body P-ring formation chaperone FlgA [Vibrio agarivorans]MDN2480550.1 flagellar basal body P-ring formation chaperone FlgA [Vibrio agarivorans]